MSILGETLTIFELATVPVVFILDGYDESRERCNIIKRLFELVGN